MNKIAKQKARLILGMLFRELGEEDAEIALEEALQKLGKEEEEEQRDAAVWRSQVTQFAGLDTYTAAEFAEAEENYRSWIASQ
jgi:hypothetical protein